MANQKHVDDIQEIISNSADVHDRKENDWRTSSGFWGLRLVALAITALAQAVLAVARSLNKRGE